MRTAPDNITALKPWEFFVFGSNLAGRHRAGAARTAIILDALVQCDAPGIKWLELMDEKP